MTKTPDAPRRWPVIPTIVVLCAAAAMIALGVWQLQRKGEKEALIALYRPALAAVLRHPRLTLCASALFAASALLPLARLGSEFMPPLVEGDLLYMPSALPGLSALGPDPLTELARIERLSREHWTVFRHFMPSSP